MTSPASSTTTAPASGARRARRRRAQTLQQFDAARARAHGSHSCGDPAVRLRAVRTPPAGCRRSSRPTSRSPAASSRSCRPSLKPPVPVTNLAQFGYGTSVATSKLVFAIMAHDGSGTRLKADAERPTTAGTAPGAITPIKRYAQMLSGYPLQNVGRDRVVLPAAADGRLRGDRQRQRQSRPGRARDPRHDGAQALARTC